MIYRVLFTVTGLFALVLGVILLVAPELYLSLYVQVYDPVTSSFAAQRLAPVVIGLGALLVMARSLSPSPFASRFAGLTGLVWFGVAATGVFHFVTGTATAMILLAAAIEVVLGALFVAAARGHRVP